MKRKEIIANVAAAGIGIIFLALIMWLVPERALNLLFISITAIVGTTLILWIAKIDQRKDERTIHLMGLGARNAFFFLIFAMPMLATFIIIGVIIMEAFVALWLLSIVSMSIAWVSFLYYYTR
ncbi:MAG: hypothetical protein ACTSYJ_05180 [Candidatus Thorarchaeota archaeon]